MLSSPPRPLPLGARLTGSALSFRRTTFVIRYQSTKQSAMSGLPRAALSWEKYLAIRKQKRKWEVTMTVPCVILGLVGGASYFGSLEVDPTKPIFVRLYLVLMACLTPRQGVDPMIFFGGATLGTAGLGYLLGPIIGSQLWRTTHRRTLALIEAKDREFHAHIVKNRVDPTAQSATNPVPDFYGEKIGSLRDYRQWLRDQAKYKRKARWTEDE
ncbi:mitochondrial import protein Pam17 [Vararia minispora EC-137]|uniref:Mitochondrial import protein Pam17 n=1 Tax=Vararia minispora EC-137 TaxID=1314806 RepID=A0ACB8QQU2_9AGAM|nr:mitochondrial import protein Pam17 [Vararia minispora EC-137]